MINGPLYFHLMVVELFSYPGTQDLRLLSSLEGRAMTQCRSEQRLVALHLQSQSLATWPSVIIAVGTCKGIASVLNVAMKTPKRSKGNIHVERVTEPN